ncbi:MAG: 16S rRNA (uracil(1498)-N(3))-methyltransferase [Pseudomonadota bacterium]
MRTFYLEPEAWQEPYQLTGQEAHHLIKVVRVRQGEQVRVLDGRGREGIFTVGTCSKTTVDLIENNIIHHPAPTSKAIIAVGWGKAVRRSWLLEKAVELEAHAIWLWQADRSQSTVPSDIKDTWQAQMIAGAKQSKNPWLPELKTLTGGVEDLLEHGKSCQSLHPTQSTHTKLYDRAFMLWEGEEPEELLGTDHLGLEGTTLYIVGPEGGFSPREVDVLRKGDIQPMSLGQRVLRWETAAVLTMGLHWWASQGIQKTSSL